MNIVARKGGERNQSGFTLVEVIVALTLLGLIFGFFASAWFSVSSIDARIDEAAQDWRGRAVARSVLEGIVEAALPWVDQEAGERQLHFAGSDDEVRFITARRDYEGGAAYEAWRLEVAAVPGGYQLLLARAPYFQGVELEEALRLVEPRPVLSFEEEPGFGYLQASDDGTEWVSQWRDQRDLPLAFRILVNAPDEAPMVAELRQRLAALCAGPLAADLDECG